MYRLRKAAAACLGAQQPGQRLDRVHRHARAEMAGSAQHRLAVRISAQRGAAPPADSFGRVARHAERVVVEHADPRHGRGDPLIGRGNRPAASLRDIGLDHLAFEQHPAQHVLRRSVALFRGPPIELGGAAIVLFDAFAAEIERRQIPLPDRIVAFRGKRQPPEGKIGITLDAEPLGEAGADIVLRAGHTGLRQRLPDAESRGVVASSGGFEGRGHAFGHRRLGRLAREAVKPAHRRLPDRDRRDWR